MKNLHQQMEKQLQEAYDIEKNDMLCLLSEEEVVLLKKQSRVPRALYTFLAMGLICFGVGSFLFFVSFCANISLDNIWQLFAFGLCGGVSWACSKIGFKKENQAKRAVKILNQSAPLTPEENEDLKILVGMLLKHPYCSPSVVSVLTELSSLLKESKSHRKFWNAISPHLENLKKQWDKKWLLEDSSVTIVSDKQEKCLSGLAVYERMLI